MNFLRLVLIGCGVMALYCFIHFAQEDATYQEILRYGFLQTLFLIGGATAFVIEKEKK